MNATTPKTTPDNRLTPRQQEILRLLCEGRSNKDIAAQLDISLGTVKQHLAALFKRMNVSNRAMAVSQGIAQQQQSTVSSAADHLGLLLRPSIAISIGLKRDCDIDSARLLHKTLAGLAFDSRAYFLERSRYSADIILGLKHYAENTVISSLQICLMLQQELLFHSVDLIDNIRIGFTINMVLVQKNRFSQDTSSDLVASPIISDSRHLMEDCQWGHIHFSENAISVLGASGINTDNLKNHCININELSQLFVEKVANITVGRKEALNEITHRLTNTAQSLHLVEGENGLGKTHLSQLLKHHLSQEQQYQCRTFQALPIKPPIQFIDTSTGEYLSYHQVVSVLEQLTSPKELVLFDDFHLVPETEQNDLIQLAEHINGTLLLLGRHLKNLSPDNTYSLARLDDPSIKQLVQSIQPDIESGQLNDILTQSRGVPFFASELSKHLHKTFPLSILMLVAARLDGFKLDWKLLHTLSYGAKSIQLSSLCQSMGTDPKTLSSSINLALKVGVLSCRGEGENAWIAFQHPLIRQVIRILSANWSQAQHGS